MEISVSTNNKDKKATIVGIYARVSTQEQATEGTSLDFQDAQLTSYCQLQKWTVINSYVDPGYSGKDGERPGLQRLLSDAKLKLFDKVVIFKLDRLARNLRLVLEIEQKLRSYGVTLISLKESLDTSSPTGKMSFQMIGMMAEWERDNIVERTKNGRLQRYKDGCWAGGKAPYGYSYDKATRKLVVNESEARIVRRMYTEYAAGKSLFGISQELNRDGIHARSKKGRGWWQVAVRQVLLNPVYKGTEVVNRHAHINLIHKMDLSNAIMMNVTPLVSEQVWQIAQDRMRTNKPGGPNRKGAHLLQGLITCGVCGYGFASKQHYYTCRGRMKYVHPDGKARCEAPYLRVDWLENEVWRRIEEILNDPNKLLLVIAENIDNLKATEAELSARISPINDQLADIAEKQAMLADDWITRHMNKDRFNELRENLNRDEARLKGLRANMDPAQIRELEDARTTLNFWEQQAKSMARNTENEDGTMFRLVDRPHRVALKLVGFDDADLNKSAGFPTSRR